MPGPVVVDIAGRGMRLARLVVALLLALLGSLVLAATGTLPQAAAAEPQVRIELTTLSPAWLTGDRITITGAVTNTSGKSMRQVQVSFWRSQDAIRDQADLANVLASPWDVPIGARMGTAEPDRNLFNLTTERQPVWPAGARSTFTVSARIADLGLQPGEGVHLIGVHVRAIPEGSYNQTVGRSRVLLPSAAPTRGSISPVVVLTSRPSWAAPGVVADDHLAQELRGRLESLLQAAERPDAVVLIDPALWDELTMLSQGYTVLGGLDPDPEAPARATAWLARFTALAQRPGVYRLPYGDPDLQAVSDDAGPLVRQAMRALPDDHPLSRLGVALAPRGGAAGQRLLEAAEPLRPVLLVTSVRNRPPAGSTGGVTVINADPDLGRGGPGPDPSSTRVQVNGRLLAQLQVGEAPGMVLVARETADLNRLQMLPSQVATRSALDLPSEPVELPAAVEFEGGDTNLVTEIEQVRGQIMAWGDLTGTTDSARLIADQVGARAASSRFWGDGAATRRLLRQVQELNGRDVARARISLTSAKTFVMSTETTGFPVTVTNNEQVPVRVKVRFVAENPHRISIPDTDVVTIAPGETATVTFTPRAWTNGVVTVESRVVTPEGRPIGASRRITVTSTNLGDIGWIIIVASGAVVLGTTAIRIKQVQRERSRAAKAAPRRAEIDLAAAVERQSRDTSARPHP
ncbi:DUF6049 family protein [Aestuariimicrobium ganziense]|uniref:DUF6049 family protein n=1 Tax=Aestuariimicrobium ganziense TaxID=2773677 RepID=UPI00194070BA|nr:DUF6049 family protein [Aestuariimicrobium ganziense]